MYSDKHQIELASDYPYTSGSTKVAGTSCKHVPSLGKVSAGGFTTATWSSPLQLQIALMKGPVAVIIDASSDMFGYYSSGILTDG
jgi:Papain family cysteine protease